MHVIRACCTSFFSGLCIGAFLFGAGPRAMAQTTGSPGDISLTPIYSNNEVAEVQQAPFASGVVDAPLPDAPEPPQQRDQDGKALMSVAPTSTTTNLPVAPMYSRVIPAGMATPQIHKWDKINWHPQPLLGDEFCELCFSAGWSHLTNGQPNYGTNSEAFGQRLGAAAIRDSSRRFSRMARLRCGFTRTRGTSRWGRAQLCETDVVRDFATADYAQQQRRARGVQYFVDPGAGGGDGAEQSVLPEEQPELP